MKKVAVVNRTNLKNYGSVLQVYALCKSIESLGYNVDVVWESGNLSKNLDIRPLKLFRIFIVLLLNPKFLVTMLKTIIEIKKKKTNNAKSEKFDSFVSSNLRCLFYSNKELKAIAKSDEYEKFICGSDQVWCSTTLYVDPMMYLRFAPNHKRIAYAPSLGRDYIPHYNEKIMRKYISDIPSVSVRERKGEELIYKLIGKSVPVVLDPTLLLTSEDWNMIRHNIFVPNDYILCYFLDEPSDEIKHSIIQYAKAQNKDIVILGEMKEFQYDVSRLYRPDVGPAEFLTLIGKSSIVITDSYHGMLFAINYKKDFWSVKRAYAQYDQSSRQLSILSQLELEDRYLSDEFSFNNNQIDYEKVSVLLDKLKSESINFLRNAINS